MHCMRDATRGGVASVLNELARASAAAIVREASSVAPIVAGAAELLGIDPMYVANEGRMVAFVAPEAADEALAALRCDAGMRAAAEIGEVKTEPPGMVLVETSFGGRRVMDSSSAIRCRGSVDQSTRRRDGMATGRVRPEPARHRAGHRACSVDDDRLSCEGDSVAMTSATNPSLEDIIQGVSPGMPRSSSTTR